MTLQGAHPERQEDGVQELPVLAEVVHVAPEVEWALQPQSWLEVAYSDRCSCRAVHHMHQPEVATQGCSCAAYLHLGTGRQAPQPADAV